MDKKSLIRQIEKLRDSKVIAYLTNDRQGPVSARIAMDAVPGISRQLRAIPGL